jgi:hypothetical protein
MSLEISEELIARQTPEAQAIIRALLDTIRRLQEQLNRSPRNSSVAPSTQHPHAKPPRPKFRAARRPGGQPGHPRQERPLLPSAPSRDFGRGVVRFGVPRSDRLGNYCWESCDKGKVPPYPVTVDGARRDSGGRTRSILAGQRGCT